MHFYPRAREKRPSIHHPSVRPRRLAILKAATLNLLLLQALFLGLFSYVFGSLFQQRTHIHNLNVLFVDYDGGAIGDSVRIAYDKLKGPEFPSLIEHSATLYPQSSIVGDAVCNIGYWGALYTSPNASNQLTAAFSGGSAASVYDRSDVLTMVWNQARYPAVVDTALANSLKALAEAARVAYSIKNGQQTLQDLNSSDPAALAALYEPWTLSSINIQPTSQGSRLIYNTLVIILVIIQEFFYLGYVNGLYVQFKLYTSVAPHRIAIARQLISAIYTLVGSLCATGAIWAFRNGWHVNGNQFVLTWVSLWLFAHLNFLVLDVFTVWLPPPYIPMALISWVVLNSTSVLLPFDLSPGFYHWGYALPANSIYQIFIDIWSGGCNPQLDYALPTLFAYEIVAMALSTIGVYRRAHYACIAQEQDEKSCQDTIAAALVDLRPALAMGQKTMQDGGGRGALEPEKEGGTGTQQSTSAMVLTEQEKLVNIMRHEMLRAKADVENSEMTFALPFKD
ncbi:hypothetical protein BDV40DRAFT_129558 [Aspergillus tamarii]|uniref:DUF3533 domain-containing protein n=1 Tax=Aspergillus tamarii TaxID=41984 RepID=A0A5N6VA43_ASPTM|nr:hypothetical protein BDV40DRAFT_129558 [Aspergillus tamarii]